MKTLLVAIVAIGLSAPMAVAECAYHARTNAAIDTATTTASITTESQSTSEETVLLKKTDRIVQDEKTAE
ncbi:hypothetical protein HT585_00320 [Ensifer sp. HO-A22]|jgi:hypothetical protein|uniref:DUF680 domain-containing protein n=1 Tax=Ensifer oleiphilus TaxID=2742698 RepID=A0A7Y6Q1F1_9HYPH|nr:hypothetical protein [Ensifer oleiphilus]NVD37284.1 hypothetical protein [Ensifer oleiphilus]